MDTISLLTDFGLEDNFVGVMKAVILKLNPQAQIVDICHNVRPQDIIEAAFLLKNSFKFFPSGTVHLVVVDPSVGSKRKKLMVKTKNYFFVGPDNGVLSPALKDEHPLKLIEVTNEKYFLKPVSETFHGRDIFAPVSAYLSRGENIEKFGRSIKSFQPLKLPKVKIINRTMLGEIIHVDHFGNLISNIDKTTLENFISPTKSTTLCGRKNKKFKIYIKDRIIDKLSCSYSDVGPKELLALIDSFNHLEVAINFSSARDYLGVGKAEKIKVVI